jgi:hypothetical protein
MGVYKQGTGMIKGFGRSKWQTYNGKAEEEEWQLAIRS